MVPLLVFMGPQRMMDSTLVGVDTSRSPVPQVWPLLPAAAGNRNGCCACRCVGVVRGLWVAGGLGWACAMCPDGGVGGGVREEYLGGDWGLGGGVDGGGGGG